MIPSARHFLFGIALSTATFIFGVASVVVFVSSRAIPEIFEVASGSDILPLAADERFESVYDVDNLGCWGDNEEDPRYGPITLPNKLVLTTVCGTLYARDSDRNLVWVRYLNAPLFDKPQMIGKDLVVIGGDLTLVGLDPNDGEINWDHDGNGRASYVQLIPFSQTSYLVRVDMSGYDDKYQICVEKNSEKSETCRRSVDDELWLMSEGNRMDGWNVPANSNIKLERGSAFATFRNGRAKKQIRLSAR